MVIDSMKDSSIEKEDKSFEILQTRKVVDILIGTTSNHTLPYLSGPAINSIARLFDVGILGSSRADMMESVTVALHKKNRTNDLLRYLLSPASLKEKIYKNLDYIPDDPNSLNNPVIQTERANIIEMFINEVNEQLYFNKKKMVFNEAEDFQIVGLNDAPRVIVATEPIDTEYIISLLTKGQQDLREGDVDSVVTKSRTILESVFRQILDDHDVVYKSDGDIGKYRKKVLDTLGMSVKSDWNPRVKTMVSSLNKLVDTIAEMRNTDGDAHDSANRIRLTIAESELLLNVAASLGNYFIRVNERQKG